MKRFLKAVAAAAAPTVAAVVQPETLVNFGLGLVAKHVVRRLPNNVIPYLNVCFSTAVCVARQGLTTGDWAAAVVPGVQQGLELAGISTLVHQGVKIPLRSLSGKSV